MSSHKITSAEMYNAIIRLNEERRKNQFRMASGLSSLNLSIKEFLTNALTKFKTSLNLSNDEIINIKQTKFIEIAAKKQSDDDRSHACKSQIGICEKSEDELLMEALIDLMTTIYEKSQIFQDEVKAENDPYLMKLYEDFVKKCKN